MAVSVLKQFPQVTRLLVGIARSTARKEAARPYVRVNLSGGRGMLADRAVNLAALTGDAATFALPDLVPGESRHFDLRLEVAADTVVTIEGCEDFELDAADAGAAVLKKERGVSVALCVGTHLFTFAETKPGTMLVTRRRLAAVA